MLSTSDRRPTRTLCPGEALYTWGDDSEALYRLERGLLRAVRLTPQGRTLTLRHIHPGDIFGEEALSGLLRTHQVRALTQSVLTPLDPRHLTREQLWIITRSFSAQLQRVMTAGVHVRDGELRERIARYLISLLSSDLTDVHPDGTRFVRVTHELLAEGTGATREAVSCVLGGLRDEGLLTLGYRHVTLRDEPALRQLARGATPGTITVSPAYIDRSGAA